MELKYIVDEKKKNKKDDKKGFQIDIKDLWCIAEYSTDPKILGDDHFVVFVTKDAWHTVPVDDNIRETLEQTSKILGIPIRLRLQSTLHRTSTVLWPPFIAERPFFEYHQISRKGIAKVLDHFFPCVKAKVTPELERFFRDIVLP